ncbi:MAG: hypothetical protein ACLSG5_13850 [Oscillospiraceae bacterium]
MEKEFADAVRATDIWSVDKYMSSTGAGPTTLRTSAARASAEARFPIHTTSPSSPRSATRNFAAAFRSPW